MNEILRRQSAAIQSAMKKKVPVKKNFDLSHISEDENDSIKTSYFDEESLAK